MPNKMKTGQSGDGRREGVVSGALIDVTGAAKAAGIDCPVVLTRAAWQACVNAAGTGGFAGNEEGQVRELVSALWLAVCRRRKKLEAVRFTHVIRSGEHRFDMLTFVAACGPDDDGSACITVCLEDELFDS